VVRRRTPYVASLRQLGTTAGRAVRAQPQSSVCLREEMQRSGGPDVKTMGGQVLPRLGELVG